MKNTSSAVIARFPVQFVSRVLAHKVKGHQDVKIVSSIKTIKGVYCGSKELIGTVAVSARTGFGQVCKLAYIEESGSFAFPA